MDSVRNLFNPQREAASAYEPLSSAQEPLMKDHLTEKDNHHSEICLCNRCGNPAHIPSRTQRPRLKIVIQVLISLVVMGLWTAFIGAYLARNPHLLHRYWNSGSKNLIDLFPIVPVDFRSDDRFVKSEPFDSPFWIPVEGKSNDMGVSAWNYYGNDWIWLEKGSPYEIPGGRPLIPLFEKDAWMKDYLGYISAYQHEVHCLGIIKNVLNSYRDGKNVTASQNHHANSHCLEVIRHSVMCHPDLTLAVPEFDAAGNEHEPYWGGEKHMCRDQKKVHDFLASRNMGFDVFTQDDGRDVIKAWSWPLPTNTVRDTGRW
ncbi:hypothetical protein CC80DRAFT_530217 [Byssothecium circinans]|uniref:Uncharacterized protein n=1 Tax=Byssothecium circinans TaxID=147558 RepID=A0A6A5UH94_9PLEO|nr:hypothetical protein CC80DRAFT_530217 [Byssothecium circinans]